MKAAVSILGFVFVLAGVSLGQQVPTITNSTLKEFKQKRLAAERDYRENYDKMGFPSPEELERQRQEDLTARMEISDQLRQARYEEQRLALERQRVELEAIRIDNDRIAAEQKAAADQRAAERHVPYFGYPNYGGYIYRRRYRSGYPYIIPFTNPYRNGGGYRATPYGVFPRW
jgi:hypothetical protein